MNCIFCDINNIQTDVIYEDELVYAFLDFDPINTGHVLITTKAHYLDMDEIPDEILSHLIKVTKRILKSLKKSFSPDGYSIMQNGGKFNDTGHFHLHIFPRNAEDGFSWTYGKNESEVNSDIAQIIINNLKNQENIMIETDRLILREYTLDDFEALFEIVSDPETMKHYPAPFSEEKTEYWINWNIDNYKKYGFGLWAVTLKETGEFIGDCGITIQNIDGEMLPEIGYHINKKYWRNGYGKEAARAARDWAFNNTDYDIIYSYMKYTNVGSYSTAIANGMKKVKEYPDPKNEISYAYAITRAEWEELKK